jgi:Cu2+-exporting ATPase
MKEQPTTEAVRCAHCGLPVPEGLLTGREREFCCNGCRTVYEVIHEHGLDKFYDVAARTGESPWKAPGGDRSYEEFDNPSFHELYVSQNPDGLKKIELYLEGVHCAACVWLVEKVPLAIPGVHEARLDVRRSHAVIVWREGDTSLSAIARFLHQLGYPSHPYRGVKVRDMRRQEDRSLLLKMGVAGAVAGNVMLIAIALYGGFFAGMEDQYERFFRWVSLLISIPAVVYPGGVFFRGAWGALRARGLHMDQPISLGISAAFLSGAWNTVTNTGEIYFDSLTMLIFLLLVGRWLERRRQREAADAAELLFSLAPSSARRLELDDAGRERIREVPLEALQPGDLVLVRPGDPFPADGLIEDGHSSADLSLLTGESRPVALGPDGAVHAGTINLVAPLRVKVEVTGENTRIGRLMQGVEEAARRKAPLVRMADRLAGWFVGTVILLAIGTFILWLQLNPEEAVNHTVALLIVTCPCALGLATPLAVSVAVGRAARSGILVKGGDVVEALSHPGRLILDKTGTVTEGRTSLLQHFGDTKAIALAARLEEHSQHPFALALDEWARSEDQMIEGNCSDVIQELGGGIRGKVDGHSLMVGSPAWIAQAGFTLPEADSWVAHLLDEALSPVLIVMDGSIAAALCFGDRLRPESREVIQRLKARGWKIGMLSGDHPAVVASVARELGLDDSSCKGGVLPEDKLAAVEAAASKGTVVMVGDGVNDAAALSAASVGISVHGGAEASLAAADVFLTRPGLGGLMELMDGSRRTVSVIRRNLVFSLCYNLLGAGLCIAGLINPLLAAVLMPLSSLTVVSSSFRSRTFTTT